MLEVHIWHPTREKFFGKKIANPLTRTVFALFNMEEHIGHAQFSITIHGDENTLHETMKKYPRLNFKDAAPAYKTKVADPTKLISENEIVLNDSYEAIASRAIQDFEKFEKATFRDETESIPGMTVSGSLWPNGSPGSLKNLVQAFFQFGNKGKVEPIYSDTHYDMLQEQEHKRKAKSIQHHQIFFNKSNAITPEVKQLQTALKNLKSEREILTKKLEKLYQGFQTKSKKEEIEKLEETVRLIDNLLDDVEVKLTAEAPHFSSTAKKELDALQSQKSDLETELYNLIHSEECKQILIGNKEAQEKCKKLNLNCPDEMTVQDLLIENETKLENILDRLKSSELISPNMQPFIRKYIAYRQLISSNVSNEEYIEEFNKIKEYIKQNILDDLKKSNWKTRKLLKRVINIDDVLAKRIEYYQFEALLREIEVKLDQLKSEVQLATAKYMHSDETEGKHASRNYF